VTTKVSTDGRLLAEEYYRLFPAELGHDPDWEDLTRIFGNWLNKLVADPEKALSTSNWHGKVSKAYFKMHGVRPVPRTKKEMVTIYLVFIATSPPPR
jgi:hypothetical protein